ncbi:MAG: hypothetical protein LBH44_11885 [Treponema sp.]|jgi:hypothetical protein|nr:hypothetical protein [Treponema sp.]
MKKFLFTLFLLAIMGGAVFFFGWAQLSVPPGAYGVILSKTHGVDSTIVQSGQLRWVWYKLIPTNVEIPVYRLEKKNFTFNVSSILPSGDNYAAFAGLGADFSWELNASIFLSINPDKLVWLVTEKNIVSQEALNAYEQEIAREIEVTILRTLTSGETDSLRLEKILSGSPDAEMEREIKIKFPELDDFSLIIKSARFPDFILYRQVRLLYEEFLAKQFEYVSSALGKKAEKHIETQFHFDELERYGELLTKYPVLLEYLSMEKGRE